MPACLGRSLATAAFLTSSRIHVHPSIHPSILLSQYHHNLFPLQSSPYPPCPCPP
ncbi:uncharacterized protein MYCFIDRAFT_212168 [Pseudocercospora fijiensis CIRAD86]|uniref:Uncharacterized protein n=1 Tax=Pseudocercospora fijiensis (strain CIRAD86) TaxID=383855 RepID=M3AP67_PSEFD|nr:uncharacterized protein MYCFIDRAFT_212168 [Pseudocercospora fijiensis CIRAD86]EME79227.1 hypothetical protein MYCFIDRAFT_212168 [Pseudocercospora fijiensis CIRAD86]